MKTALITGASSGIGKEFARRYAEKGYRLILTARRESVLQRFGEELSTDVVIIPADLSDEKQCFELLEKLKD